MRVLLVSVCVLFLFILANSFYEETKMPIEMIAFNELTSEERERILVSPKDSSVRELTVSEELGKQLGANLVGKKLYMVTFNHTETVTSGNLIVYVDMENEEVVGKLDAPL
ncbi:hypothetical protein [Sutcliffiella deserti]|uniref:hypothetical protein n=1 Tax=Sutcliffiella deserti TaxID=2875501 RepID=UPI001CBB0E43|nr:hypothetical protein [Sutcliffiella deserti]